MVLQDTMTDGQLSRWVYGYAMAAGRRRQSVLLDRHAAAKGNEPEKFRNRMKIFAPQSIQ